MSFITLTIACDEEEGELLIAELSLFPFSAFEETETGILASCEEEEWTEEEDVKVILDRYKVSYQIEKIEKVNWNEEWEKNYDPVIVGDQAIVRATFHPARPEIPYEIIITPKMSFGTGHHATTYQVLKYQLELDQRGKSVLDVGCGTGALAIMAHKRGASEIVAVDIDEWCVENSTENFSLNACEEITLKLGGIESIDESSEFDIILANINKNVLLAQIPEYKKRMKQGGVLVLSGFYSPDIIDLMEVAKALDLKEIVRTERDKWAMLVLKSD